LAANPTPAEQEANRAVLETSLLVRSQEAPGIEIAGILELRQTATQEAYIEKNCDPRTRHRFGGVGTSITDFPTPHSSLELPGANKCLQIEWTSRAALGDNHLQKARHITEDGTMRNGDC
jgi:hypothetical protein